MKISAFFILALLGADASLPIRPTLVSGTVRVVNPPRPKRIRFDDAPEAQALHPNPVFSEDVAVDAQNRVKWAFVYVKRGLEGRDFPKPAQAAVLKHEKCFFSPRVLGVRVGQDVKIRNEDDFMHSTHAVPMLNREFCFGHPAKGPEETRKFDRAEVMIPFMCRDHRDWERAWVAVLDHPFFAVTGPDGRYEINDLPPGRYTIEVWQHRYRSVSREIDLRSWRRGVLDFTLTEEKP